MRALPGSLSGGRSTIAEKSLRSLGIIGPAMAHPRLSGGVECHAVALTRNPTSRFLVRRDVRLFYHLAPDLRFLRDEGLRFGGRAGGGGEVDLAEVILSLRALEHVVDRLVELDDDRRRGFRRRGDGIPGGGLKSLHAGLVERRDVGQVCNARRCSHRKNARLPALVKLDRGSELHENEVHMARDNVGERRRGALVAVSYTHMTLPTKR